ncbi:hypothetical protein NHE_0102 [Neorickettsia helminthoeca str. Oregon]|uniref:Uncharacterized protein n=2 Tax=Neorickettsia helminthoeca TaxID=33994 RepID=X5GVK3_9RICK|nr:hypothetical protein NHE_0102 [Neorickettsia helminthoeca str. Oregon]
MYKRWRGENINPYQCGHGCGQMVEGFVEGVRDAQQGDNQNGPGSDGAPSSNLMDPDVDGGKSRQRSREH